MRHVYALFTFWLICSANLLASNDEPIVLCVPFGQGYITDLFTPGEFGDDNPFFVGEQSDLCYQVDDQGGLYFGEQASEARCCGQTYTFTVEALTGGDPSTGQDVQILATRTVELTIKCPKPSCDLVELDLFNDGSDQDVSCLSACENSEATYLFDDQAGLTYAWSANNGVPVYDPGLPGQVTVTWGTVGPADLTVMIDNNGTITTRTFCVELNPTPEADFSAAVEACLGQPVQFTNLTTGPPATYDWDFGDGNTAQSTANPSHTYDTPGTYDVTLYATSDNYDQERRNGCCCVDSITYSIKIDPLPGPSIFWVSTLCEGDTSQYWTDATGCGLYQWDVSFNGAIIDGAGTDTITVVWGSGPTGEVTLDAGICDTVYCNIPTTVQVPIISSNGFIDGPIEVCAGDGASYELPKWMTVAYDWVSTGFIVGANDGNSVSVQWPFTPGTYTLDATYGSEFLQGLPNHNEDDCTGSASLSVTVLGDFSISAFPNPACVGATTTIFVNSTIGGQTFDFAVDGFPGLGGSGSSHTVTWPAAGAYKVTATAVDPTVFCNPVQTTTVFVEEAIQPSIISPADYCAGEEVIVSIGSPVPGYGYTWSVAGGSVTAGQGTPSATIVFTNPSSGSVSVFGTMGGAPSCSSASTTVSLTTIDFMGNPEITGTTACTNQQDSYEINIPQHPSAVYEWSISPTGGGSIVNGQGTDQIDVQWNDAAITATVTCAITICGQTQTPAQTYQLIDGVDPEILQTGDLCPGNPVTLDLNTTFSSQAWSTSSMASSITVTSPGTYQVNTVDGNDCEGFASTQVSFALGPVADVTTSGDLFLCVNDRTTFPAGPTLSAITTTGIAFEWFCDNISQGPPSASPTFTHVWNDTIKTYTYEVRVTDQNGCSSLSDPVLVFQEDCVPAGGGGCDISQLSTVHDFTITNESPFCDTINLQAIFSQDSVDEHRFISNADFDFVSASGSVVGGTVGARLALNGVGCYDFTSRIGVYNTTTTANGDLDSVLCTTFVEAEICNPLLADFTFEEVCGEVTFTNQTLQAPGLLAGPLAYSWDLDDNGATATGPNPVHQFSANGSYDVTMTVTDGNCSSRTVITVVVDQIPDVSFTAMPTVACAGEVIEFTSDGTGEVNWEWDFGDSTQLIQEVGEKTYFPTTTTDYLVTLEATDINGCVDTAQRSITVNPTPAEVEIVASPAFIICEGSSTTLSVPNDLGNDYLWSDGQNGSSIAVAAAGIYDVTITNQFDCSFTTDEVEVQVIPLPDATITGDLVTCGTGGTTTLTANASAGFLIEWTNLTTGAGTTGPTLQVSAAGLGSQEIELRVTHPDHGCTSTAIYVVVEEQLPDVQITLTGSGCAGDPNLLSITNPDANVTYNWSNGATGLTTTTSIAGSTSVVATNTVTGCRATGSIFINPLPDVCSVPTGCYETCDPDTLYAPIGDNTYEWAFNGTVISTEDSLIVSTSGEYQLTVEDNQTGCSITTESLFLEVIDCDGSTGGDCEDLQVTLEPINANDDGTGGCCYAFGYSGLPEGTYYGEIVSADAGFDLDPGSSNGSFGYLEPITNGIQFANDFFLNDPLPEDSGPGFAFRFCLTDVIESPQVLVITFYNDEGQVLCREELSVTCEPEPDCAYVAADAIICDDEQNSILQVEVCVPANVDYPVAFLQFLPQSPTADGTLPQSLTLAPGAAPGTCQTVTLELGMLAEGAEFCYQMVAHSEDPAVNPAALCCSTSEIRCLTVPDCDPCDDLDVEVARVGDDCCYDIFLFNDEEVTFTQMDVCLMGGDGSTISATNSIGSNLLATTGADGQSITINPATGDGLPNGSFSLPRICLEGNSGPETLMEIKWLNGENVLCRDTVALFCEPDCGYLLPEESFCEAGSFVWTGQIVNTSVHTMDEAYVDFPAPLDAYDQTATFTPLAPGASTSISLAIGSPATPNQEICVDVILHETNDDEFHLNCCSFESCILLPDCQIAECNCEDFPNRVNFTFAPRGGTTYRMAASGGDFNECDEFIWEYRPFFGNVSFQQIGTTNPLDFTFPSASFYTLRLTVIRYDANGQECNRVAITRSVFTRNTRPVGVGGDVRVFPNPAANVLYVETGVLGLSSETVTLYDAAGRPARVVEVNADNYTDGVLRMDVSTLRSGVYMLRSAQAEKAFVKRVVISR